MTASDSFEGHDPLGLILIILAALVIVPTLAVYGFSTLARQGIRHSGTRVVLRGFAALAAGAAVAVYAWGVVQLALMVGPEQSSACQDAVGGARAASIDRYEGSYLPLQLNCHVPDDGMYSADVIPGYVNPGALGLVLTAAVLAVSSGLAPERRTGGINSAKEASG
ncbi:hypothetical protein [Streptomyces sp. NPDC059009]|uniref:hypothetical protein n=1 Tax=Streptomyces sp. NPDC059009 TaxID=3346694 RepID=UPI003697A4C5